MQNSSEIARPITLLGMMGSGKTSVSQCVAHKLQRQFFDSDAEIEKKSQKTISQIFSENGEEFFRALEEKIITKIIAEKNIILAIGGGAFVQEKIRNLLLEKTFCIWLDASVETIFARLAEDKTRPLLANKSDADKKNTIFDLLQKRRKAYEKAHLRICVDNLSIEQIAEEILNKIIKNRP